MNTATNTPNPTARMLRLAQPVEIDGVEHLAVLNTEHAALVNLTGLVRRKGRHWVLTAAGIAAREQALA